VRCLVQNPASLLKLEMFATIEIPTEQTNPVVSVLASSMQQINGEPVVFLSADPKLSLKCARSKRASRIGALWR